MKLTDITTEDLTTLVGLLTLEQKDKLVGQQYAPDSYFYPIQDINDNWIISIEEIKATDIEWVKEIPLIAYTPIKPIEPTIKNLPTELSVEDQVAEIITEDSSTNINSSSPSLN